MENTDRRKDAELRAVIDQAIEFKKTMGQGVAMSFLAEHYIPSPLLERVLVRPQFTMAKILKGTSKQRYS